MPLPQCVFRILQDLSRSARSHDLLDHRSTAVAISCIIPHDTPFPPSPPCTLFPHPCHLPQHDHYRCRIARAQHHPQHFLNPSHRQPTLHHHFHQHPHRGRALRSHVRHSTKFHLVGHHERRRLGRTPRRIRQFLVHRWATYPFHPWLRRNRHHRLPHGRVVQFTVARGPGYLFDCCLHQQWIALAQPVWYGKCLCQKSNCRRFFGGPAS